VPTTSTTTPEDAQIRECMDTWAQALHDKDVNVLMALYSTDMVTFDLRPPSHVDTDAYRKNFEAWFASAQGPIGYEICDQRISTSIDLAICHYRAHVRSTRKTGEKTDYWVRVTSGFGKRNGQWLITHEHVSMPINLMTMQAAPDLES
jgi:uncharacterized protein (TIGR02246 family)